jgi:hypothetical protein
MIVSTRVVPRGFDAITIWPLILIRPEQRSDTGLITHEMTHYRAQAWITPWWLLRYWLSPTFRLAAEVAGYRSQIEVGDISIDQAAAMLLRYKLGITYAQALAALR